MNLLKTLSATFVFPQLFELGKVICKNFVIKLCQNSVKNYPEKLSRVLYENIYIKCLGINDDSQAFILY